MVVAAFCLIYAQAAWAKGLEQLPYTSIQASYFQLDFDSGLDADGIAADVSFDVGGNMFILGGYGSGKTDRHQAKFSGFGFGLGYHHALNPTVDLVPTLTYIDATTEFPSYDVDDTGWSAGLGLRALVSPQIELAGGVEYTDLYNDRDTSYELEAYFYPLDKLGLGVGYDISEDVDTLLLTARVLF